MTHETNEPEKNDQRATQGLDPAPVDEPCRVVVVPLASGQSVTVSMRSVAPLTGEEEAALGEIVRAAAARMEREHPHAGVITALMQASLRSRVVLRAAGEGDLADRLGVATEPTYRDQVRAALAQTDSSWGEATGDGDASPDYIDTLTESVVYLRDDELAKTKHALVFQRGTIIDRTRERDEARAERGLYRDSAVAYAAQVAELNAELAGLRADNTRWMEQNERIAEERDEARRVVAQVNNNHGDFAEALGLSRDAYGDEIIATARQLAGLRERAGDWRGQLAELQSLGMIAHYAHDDEPVESWRASPEPAAPAKPLPCNDFVGDGLRCQLEKGHAGRCYNGSW